ncbi:lipase family protein [Niabella soli]|uniref:Fungal lipase-type domain-containing protein n=1 Tax=Niabella soli DSM 19437 TaxID=929713 RepID=W0F1Y8_9BACT|nr:lipase class 3 [Niabella soli]AHF17022.1 hypothetical protein NIASO_00440 [Niabella soli DSM 19437]
MTRSKFVIVLTGSHQERLKANIAAKQFVDYAIFSSNIYPENKTSSSFIPVKTDWEKIDEAFLPKIPLPILKTQKMICGLVYEVWHRKTENKIEIVISFKGTTPNVFNDWICNLRWFTLNPVLRGVFHYFFWDYYHQVQMLIPQLISTVKNIFPNKSVEFISTGHSLGGGLAQQAAYATNDIKKVFAFNPSPVTGYKDIKKNFRKINEIGIEICRIYQAGEVLFFFRKVAKYFYPLTTVDPEIKEYKFSFFKGDSIERHAMRKLAINLINASKTF